MNFVTTLGLAAIGLALAALGLIFFGTSQQNDLYASITTAYDVKVIDKEVHLFSNNKLVIEKDGQRMTCDFPSRAAVEAKTPLDCSGHTPVRTVDPAA